MSNKTENEWLPLAQHEQWLVEYRPDSRIVRVHLGENVMYLEREAYQLLWGMVTEGLDELERVEDDSARLVGLKHPVKPQVAWPQTRH
ncbi:hypothetical protein LCGC14_0570670 [marine sediment metagenome]|uniref:Uncharacterized protein n=1 Tax=marine sediment metagenome TaxID=412755 RepID=A0A0F9USI7_9ZZZZ|nr:hypothetical protein [Methylophaga sp.]HEC58812.1 hypothetical protein [Methylophaga sp.]